MNFCSDLLERCSLTKNLNQWSIERPGIDKDADFLIHGIAQGFNLIPDLDAAEPAECENYQSASEPHASMLSLFQDEFSRGHFHFRVLNPSVFMPSERYLKRLAILRVQ